MKLTLSTLFLSCLVGCASSSDNLAAKGVASTVQADGRPDHFPDRNVVTMRTLNFRNVEPGALEDPFPAMDAFHADRLEWVYLSFTERERQLIQRVKDSGRVFGGASSSTLNNWQGDKSILAWENRLAMLDLDGHSVTPPHKRKWAKKTHVGDPTNPEYLDGHVANYLKYVDFGADTLQRDELRGFVTMADAHGGGFTPTAMTAFRQWLAKNLSPAELSGLGIEEVATFDYGDYLRAKGAPVGDDFAKYKGAIRPYWIEFWEDVSMQFYTDLVRRVKEGAGRPITFSCNNSSLQVWDAEVTIFDFAISELLLGSAHPNHIWERSVAARNNGKLQVFGSPKTRGTDVNENRKVALTRKVIATAYASGSASRVPWDIFLQTENGNGRYFGTPEQYGDLYAFVSEQDWSGYDDITAYGIDIEVDPVAEGSLTIQGNDHVYAMVNRHPDASQPLLIHLVDWGAPEVPVPPKSEQSFVESRNGERLYFSENGEENLLRTSPRSFTLRIDAKAHGLGSKAAFTLLTPSAYGAAEAVSRQALDATFKDGVYEVSIDALNPWAILEVR